MSEEPKKTNKYVTRYEQIHKKLEKVVSIYTNSLSDKELKEFILKYRKANKEGLRNSLIEVPEDNMKNVLQEQYASHSKVKGEIGTIPIEDQSYEIKSIAILILMSNRLSKFYSKKLDNQCLDEQKRQIYSKNERELLVWKENATSELIASLYILNKTGGKEYQEYFSYGERKDKDKGTSTFVIDLPYIGQMSVHFGPDKLNIIEEARSKAMSILERKKALGQINKDDLKRLIEGLKVSKILPKYEGKLYEYSSALPIEYIGPTAKRKAQEIGLDSKLPEEITKEDIQKMAEIGLNEREAYYLGIKLGCPKEQLKEVIKTYKNRERLNQNTNLNKVTTSNRSTTQSEHSKENEKLPIEKRVGRKAVIMSTATQREAVVQFENRNLQKYKLNENGKAMGG